MASEFAPQAARSQEASGAPLLDADATRKPIGQLRAVAMPTEHGGWSLSLEPAILGLLIVASWSGVLLTLMGLLAFVARTPLKIVLVDRWRGRHLERTTRAKQVLLVEVALLGLLLAGVVVLAEHGRWWIPFLVGIPLIGVEFSYDMRSRGRRLVPLLVGPIGVGVLAPSVVLLGGGSTRVAIGSWVAISVRSVASILFVRSQVSRVRRGGGAPQGMASGDRRVTAWAVALQLGAVLTAAAAWLVGVLPGSIALLLGALVAIHLILGQREVQAMKVIGFQQLGFGVTFVVAAGLFF